MRGFGRSWRGHGHVFLQLVRHTERHLLALGEPITPWGLQAKARLAPVTTLGDTRRQRLALALPEALTSHEQIRKQSTRLPQGKKRNHGTLVKAYDPPMAPLVKGKSKCPAQFGSKPGLASDPATAVFSLPPSCPRAIPVIPALCCP